MELGTTLLHDDDENLELWFCQTTLSEYGKHYFRYVTGVAGMMGPNPDYQFAKYHLDQAMAMVTAMREEHVESGESLEVLQWGV